MRDYGSCPGRMGGGMGRRRIDLSLLVRSDAIGRSTLSCFGRDCIPWEAGQVSDAAQTVGGGEQAMMAATRSMSRPDANATELGRDVLVRRLRRSSAGSFRGGRHPTHARHPGMLVESNTMTSKDCRASVMQSLPGVGPRVSSHSSTPAAFRVLRSTHRAHLHPRAVATDSCPEN